MWCDPPTVPSAEPTQPVQSSWPSDEPDSPVVHENKQVSFMYQPGVGLYDHKKIELDQDLRMTSTTSDVDERIQVSGTPSIGKREEDLVSRSSQSSDSLPRRRHRHSPPMSITDGRRLHRSNLHRPALPAPISTNPTSAGRTNRIRYRFGRSSSRPRTSSSTSILNCCPHKSRKSSSKCSAPINRTARAIAPRPSTAPADHVFGTMSLSL